MSETMQAETRGFEAEVAKLLKMMVHSVYSEQEIFLRELISNASDACDKLRYEALTKPDLLAGDGDFAIDIMVDATAKTLVVSDNGIGMSRQDLIDNLGTIARSGTAAFLDSLSGDAKKDATLIGQFGVGFYSVFMVADQVEVVSRKAGDDDAASWQSDGAGEYTLGGASRDSHGTSITLHLNDDATSEFLNRARLENIVRTYSDHIAHPIRLTIAAEDDAPEDARINQGQALWTRAKSDITEEQYAEFYRHVGHAWDAPAFTLHSKAEGVIEYTALLFIPEQRPIDLFDPARKPRVKLYVKRIFITDDTDDLIPGYLRFIRGVIDSQDLPLNVSREMLQSNPVVRRIRKAVTNKLLSELEKLVDKKPEDYAKIWDAFGPVLKEGLYEDEERREQLLKLVRFKSSTRDTWVSLADYVAAMKDKQSAIYYVTGADPETVARQPHLEGFKARGIEVLLLSDPVDDFWLSAVSDFEGKPLKSITKGASDLKDIGGDEGTKQESDEDKASDTATATLIARIKTDLGDKVADVRISDRLTETPCCLVADDNAMDASLERLLRAHNQLQTSAPKILEINPDHPMIAGLKAKVDDAAAAVLLNDAAHMLFDQATILEGEPVDDPAGFSRRMATIMQRAFD